MGTWKILNGLISKKVANSNFPEKLMTDGKTVEGSKDIADGFNDFFTNVGPKLTKNIVPPNKNVSVFDSMKMVQ